MSEWGGGNNVASTQLVGPVLSAYFKLAKECGTVGNLGCLPSSVNLNYDGSGSNQTTLDSDWKYKFLTIDGMAYTVDSNGSGCTSGHAANDNLSQICGYVTVDVNGPSKLPNIYGRDVFFFYISNGKGPLLYPIGGQQDSFRAPWTISDCGTNGSNAGQKCTGRIIEENWQMNY